MKRKLLVIVAALATAFATALPAIGSADDAPELSTDRTVEQGQYNSYIVVMQADPLIITEGKDNLDTRKAKARGDAMKASHGEALEDAGVSSAEIVNNYVNALNGFSATLTYAEAQKVASQNGVAMVIPDELQQATTDSSPTFLGLDGSAGPWATGVDGEGVIGFLQDIPATYQHNSFLKTSKLLFGKFLSGSGNDVS